jgi:hypothetical protein
VVFKSGLELGVRAGGLIRGLVPKSGLRLAEPELGQAGVGLTWGWAESEVGRHAWTRI